MKAFLVQLPAILLFLSCSFATTTFAQSSSTAPQFDSDTVPEIFRKEVVTLRKLIYSKVPNHLKVDVKQDRRTYLFAHYNAIRISDIISGGMIYSNWAVAENYLNEILQKIMPAELKNDTNIHVYLAKEGEINAYMLPSGHIIFNVGTLAFAKDESMIAGILAHELAHYHLDHMLYQFLDALKASSANYYGVSSKFRSNSRKAEMEADALAHEWLYKAGIGVDGEQKFFEIVNLQEQKLLDQSEDLWELEVTTHPASQERLEKVLEFKQTHPLQNEGNQIVNKDLLDSLRPIARSESLRHFLDQQDYYACIETGFQYHILEPGNSAYIYYILEGIRRKCYSNVNLWNEKFITNRYYEPDPEARGRKKRKINYSLFHSLNPKILGILPADTSEIKAKRYWTGKVPFETYEQAFEYLYTLSQALNDKEAVLSKALSLIHDKSLTDKYLRKYLAFPEIKYREFAQALLNDSIYQSLDTNRVIVLMHFIMQAKMQKETLRLTSQPSDSLNYVGQIMTGVSQKLDNRRMVIADDLRYEHARDFRLLKELFQYSQYTSISIGSRMELQIVNPEFWLFFRRHKINQLDFIACLYEDPVSGQRTTAFYNELIEEGIDPLFYPPQRQRFLELFTSKLRIAPTGITKRRRRYSTHFGNIKVSVPEIVHEIVVLVKLNESEPEPQYFNLGNSLFLQMHEH